MRKTRVVNLKKYPYDVYIGRSPNPNDGYFGNPFYMTGLVTREVCINQFRSYFYRRIKEDAEFKKRVEELKGRSLGCYCKPKDCHGDVYVEYLEGKK